MEGCGGSLEEESPYMHTFCLLGSISVLSPLSLPWYSVSFFSSVLPHPSFFSHLYPRYPLKTLGAAELYASGISGLVAAIDISVVCFPSLWCPEGRKRERGRSKGRLSVYYLVCFYVNFNDPPFPGSPKSKSPLQKDLHTLNTRAQAGTRTSLTNGNYGRATMSTEKYLCLKYTAKDCPLAF